MRLSMLHQIDLWLVAAALCLVVLGLAAIDVATESTPESQFVARQLVWAAIGFVAMCLAAWPSYRLFADLAYAAFAVCLGLLVVIFWTEPVNGAQRWLRAGPIGVQPSELAKLAFVLALARYLGRGAGPWGWTRLAVCVAMAVLPMLLVLKQPDLGTALVFVPVLGAMLFVADVPRRHLAVLAAAGLIATPLLWMTMTPVQRSRVSGFLEQRDTGPRPTDHGYQLYQSKLMVALGGTLGTDDAIEQHVPFDHTDFIFSVVAGRWGLAGVTALLVLFAVLLGRGICVAGRAAEPLARLVAVGVVALLAAQAIINMAMTIGLAPVTGLTLPLVSYGGSSLLTSFIAVGMLLGIERRTREVHV